MSIIENVPTNIVIGDENNFCINPFFEDMYATIYVSDLSYLKKVFTFFNNFVHTANIMSSTNKDEITYVPLISGVSIENDNYEDIIEFLGNRDYILFVGFPLSNMKMDFSSKKNVSFVIDQLDNDVLSYEEFCNVRNYIHNIVSYINRFNLSNMEKIILLFDLVRQRPYKKDGTSSPRLLSDIYKHDNIVCAGYSRLVYAVLNEMGIKTSKIDWESSVSKKLNGHSTNAVFLDDDKYDIHDWYFIDATANYDGTITDYNRLLLPLSSALKLYERKGLKFHKTICPISQYALFCYKRVLDDYAAPENALDLPSSEVPYFTSSCYALLFRLKTQLPKNHPTYQSVINLLKDIRSYDSKEELKDAMLELIMSITQDIPVEKLGAAIINVRRVESSIDFDKYSLDNDDITHYISKRYGFNIDPETRLLMRLLDINPHPEYSYDVIKDSKYSNVPYDTDKDECYMKLISLLHKLAKDDVDKNPTFPKRRER